MKVLSIAVLALALYPGIDARDSPHHKEKGRVRVGQHEALQEHDGYSGEYSEEIQQDEEGYLESDSQEGYLESDSQEGYSDEAPRERGYAHVEEKGLVDTHNLRESIASREGVEKWVQLRKIKCVQASTSWDWNRFADFVTSVFGACKSAGEYGKGFGGGFTIQNGVCVVFQSALTANSKLELFDWNEIMAGSTKSDYPDNLQIRVGQDKVYPMNAKYKDLNTGDEVKIPENDRAKTARKVSTYPTYCLREVDFWGDDSMGCIAFTNKILNDKATEYVTFISHNGSKSLYYLEFDVLTVTSTSPIVSVSKIRCKEVEDAGWWENDEVVLEVNGQSVWPENGKKYTISDGKVKRFNGGEMKKYGFSTSTNPKFCLYEYDGSKKDTKMGCHKFKGSDYKVNCDKNPGYKYRQTAHWRAGGGYYVVDFLIQCP